MDQKENSLKFMERAVTLALENIQRGGGPFGAVIVRNGQIIAEGYNEVTPLCDPTAHAEVQAIRNACKALGSFELTDCDVYTSCEPCPMCLGAIYWARPARVFYALTKKDAAQAGFDDDFIYQEIEIEPAARKIPMTELLCKEALAVFKAWAAFESKTKY